MITVNGFKLNITNFPDNTSQVWKNPSGFIDSLKSSTTDIVWNFEHEVEIVYLMQFAFFLEQFDIKNGINSETRVMNADIPYMPYARQDKDVDDSSCWALHLLVSMLSGFDRVTTFDVHNPDFFTKHYPKFNLVNMLPTEKVKKIIKDNDISLVIFPDKGAANRYGNLCKIPFVSAQKVRDQLTGDITSFSIPEIKTPQNVLVWDDLCDGGRTFVEVAKCIPINMAPQLILYVSHGIFSKGTDLLLNLYNRVYTRLGEVVRDE